MNHPRIVRPAARAVIFARLVDDPSAHPDIFKTKKAQEMERHLRYVPYLDYRPPTEREPKLDEMFARPERLR